MSTYRFTEKREERVLAWVNRMRAKHQIGRPLKRLPRGVVARSRACPLAKALSSRKRRARVDPHRIRWYEDDHVPVASEGVPYYIGWFIVAFDEGACSRLRKLAVKP